MIDRVAARQLAGRVHAGDQALAAGLLVARSAVDLAGQVQARDGLHLQRVVQFARVDRIVLDGVAGADHLGVLEPGNRRDHRRLHVDRHAGGHAVDVDFVGVEALRLQKDLVTRACPGTSRPCLRSTGSSAGRRLRSARCRAASARWPPSGCAASPRWCSRCGTESAAGRSAPSGTRTASARDRRAAARSAPNRWCGRRGAAACRSSGGSSSGRGCAVGRPAAARAPRRCGRSCSASRRRGPGRSGTFRW